MGNWGDDIDEELTSRQAEEKPHFTLNAKAVFDRVDYYCDHIKHWDEKYPLNCLRALWGDCMLGLFLCILFSYQIVMIATLPIGAFFFAGLVKITKGYKQFGYGTGKYWLVTVPLIVVMVVITVFLQPVVVNAIL